MKTFDIQPVDRSLAEAIQHKIDNLNKPKGSLGRLEELAMQVCLIQQTLEPSLAHPCHLLLGGVSENALQRRFTDLQGWMNQYIAQKADEVMLMVSGIPVKVKG